MPFWDRLFKINVPSTYQWERVFARAHALEQRGEDPRRNPDIGEGLGLLWEENLIAPSESATSADQAFLRDFVWYLRQRTPKPPPAPEARYQAVVEALRDAIRANTEELRLTEEPFPIDNLRRAIWMVEQLQAAELHAVCCELLVTVNATLIRERQGNRVPPLESLRTELHGCLAALPPDAMPRFWEMLQAESTSEDFWPVAARMRDRRAMPFLLEALPVVPPDGQAIIAVTLGNIGDTRALPALQQLAAEETSLVAPIAKEAVARILRTSGDDAALLLRPTDAPHAGSASKTLLRPAAATPAAASRPEELLRSSNMPLEKEP